MKKFLSRLSVAVFLALVISLISTFALSAMPAQADSSPECWAVLVGVSDYQYVNDLSFCDDDARDLSDVLTPVWGSSHVRTLIDSQATKANILDAIDWLADNAGADDTVLFTFSGHGVSLGYICPYDVLTNSYANEISTAELANALQPIAAKKIVVVLDSCYSGKFQSSLSSNGRVILMACASNELSWDSYTKQNGDFSYYVIKALDEFDIADANGDYELSAEEVAQYANPLTTIDRSTMHPVLDDRFSGQLALLAKFVFDMNLFLPFGTPVLTLDGDEYTVMPAPMIWVPGVSHTMAVPEMVDQGTGTRYVFTQWDDGSVTATRIITKGSYTANYDKEHLLEVISAFGETGGAGWYKDGSSAGFSVTDYIELPDTKHIFTGWSGDFTGTAAEASLTMDDPATVTANWRHEYLLTLNSEYGQLTGAGWYKQGETAGFSITPYIELPDTKHYFTGWSGSYTGTDATASLVMDSPAVVDAGWRHEYLLTLNSEYGAPTGAGWYKEGETAPVSVEPIQGVIVRQIFTGWSGDLTDTAADSSVTMDSPMVITANWRTDYIQLYILIGGVVVLIAAVVITIVIVRRRRQII